MSIRDKFVKSFGEKEARQIEEAALSHSNGVNSKNKGSDQFKWAILICIGYECLTRFHKYHKIKTPFIKLKKWIRDNADLGSHDGDCDYIALFVGAYKPFIKSKTTPTKGKEPR